MAINPRKIKKKVTPRPAKDLRSTDPKDLRNKALREANRAANENKPKTSKPTPAKSAKLPTPKVSAGSQLFKGAIKKVPVVGTAIGFIADASPAGEGSDKPTGPLMKGNRLAEGRSDTGRRILYKEQIGPKKPSVSPSTGAGRPEYPSSNKMKTSGGTPFQKGKGTASLPKVKSSTSSTAATTAAASSSTTGKTTGKSTTVVKERVGLQSRYQRDALAMETRNKSGNKAKKSILSLFRKG